RAEDEPKSVADAWRITEKLIEHIVDTTRARGIAYVGLVAPFEMVLQPTWAAFAAAQPPPRLDGHYPEDRLGALFTRLRVPSVLLTDYFQPYLKEVLPF